MLLAEHAGTCADVHQQGTVMSWQGSTANLAAHIPFTALLIKSDCVKVVAQPSLHLHELDRVLMMLRI